MRTSFPREQQSHQSGVHHQGSTPGLRVGGLARRSWVVALVMGSDASRWLLALRLVRSYVGHEIRSQARILPLSSIGAGARSGIKSATCSLIFYSRTNDMHTRRRHGAHCSWKPLVATSR